MARFEHLPLGRAIPDLPHSVSCSIPTLADVRGYEEKRPEVISRMPSGYPRFVVHPFTRRLSGHIAAAGGLQGRTIWLASSERMARALAAHLGDPAQPLEYRGVHGVSHPDSAEMSARAKAYLQNVGGFLSSRQAEDVLAAEGLAPAPACSDAKGSRERIVAELVRSIPGASAARIELCSSGTNAVYSAFQAVSAQQAPKGRTAWIQMGWVYLDTIAILRKFTASASDYLHAPDVRDKGGVERLFEANAGRIAGVFAEVPTNPLVQTPDLPWLAKLCRRHGARLVVDPSVVGAFDFAGLDHADVLVTSLTKYAANEGDVIAGMLAVGAGGDESAELLDLARLHLEPCYVRDLDRLAAQIGETRSVLERIERSTRTVAAFLSSHPAVTHVHWALQGSCADNLRAVVRRPGACGCMITFSVRGRMDRFYDALRLPKGPSFGMKTTLVCPFMYLAHYDLVESPAGREELARSGLDSQLLRLAVGVEPVEEIVSSLGEALAGLAGDAGQ